LNRHISATAHDLLI